MEFQAYNCFLSQPVALLYLAVIPLIQTKPGLFFGATHLLIRDSWDRARHLQHRSLLCTLAALTSLCFLQQALIAWPKGCCFLSVHAHLKWLSIQWKAVEIRDASPILTFPPLSYTSLRTSNLKLHSTISAFCPFATALRFSTQTLFSSILMHLLSPCDFIYCITKSSKCTLNGCFPSFPASLAQTIPWGSCGTEAPSSAQWFPTLCISRTWPSSSPAHNAQMKSTRPWRSEKAPDSVGFRIYVTAEQMEIYFQMRGEEAFSRRCLKSALSAISALNVD